MTEEKSQDEARGELLQVLSEKPDADQVEPATELEDWTVEELKDELRERGMKVSGNKDELVNRLHSLTESDEEVEPVEAEEQPVEEEAEEQPVEEEVEEKKPYKVSQTPRKLKDAISQKPVGVHKYYPRRTAHQ